MRAASRRFAAVLIALATAGSIATSIVADAKKKINTPAKATVEPSEDNLEEGKKKFDAGDYKGAIDAFLQSVYFARNGYAPDAYFWLGSAYARDDQDDKAIECYKKNIQQSLDPQPNTHLLLGEIYLKIGRAGEARTEGGEALTLSRRHNNEAYCLIAKSYAALGNNDSALHNFLSALQDPPWHYTDAWVNYAELLLKMRNYGAAWNQFKTMLQNTDDLKDFPYERVYIDVGLCKLAKGDHQGALDNWYEAIKVNPNSYKAHLQIGLVLDQEHHYSSAIKEYKEYVRTATKGNDTVQIANRIQTLENQLNPSAYTPQPAQQHPNVAPVEFPNYPAQPPPRPSPPADPATIRENSKYRTESGF